MSSLNSVLNFNAENVSKLDKNCWKNIFSHLDLKSQYHLSQTRSELSEIFGEIVSSRYKTINGDITRHLSIEDYQELLDMIGDYVKNYSLYYRLDFPSSYTNQRRASWRFVREIITHNNTVSYINKSDDDTLEQIEIGLAKCRNLESFQLSECHLKGELKYEVVCQLPKLQHIVIWTKGYLRPEFLKDLLSKPGDNLLTLHIKGRAISRTQVEHICKLISLHDLWIFCKEVPLRSLLKLNQLEILTLTMPSIIDEEALALLKGLPELRTFTLEKCKWITDEFAVESYEWMEDTQWSHRKLTVYLQGSAVDWEFINRIVQPNFKCMLKIMPKADAEYYL